MRVSMILTHASAVKNRIVGVLTSDSIHLMRDVPADQRALAEGMVEFALATIWDTQFQFNHDRAAQFVAKHGPHVEPVLEYKHTREESRAALIAYCNELAIKGRRAKFVRVIESEVAAALPPQGPRFIRFRHGDPGKGARPQSLGGRVLSARVLFDTTRGQKTHTGLDVGRPSYVPAEDREELDRLWPNPSRAVATTPAASSSTARRAVVSSDWEADNVEVAEEDPDSDAAGDSASEVSAATRPQTRAATAAVSGRAASTAQPQPVADEVPRKRARQDDHPRDTSSPSVASSGYIGSAPAHMRRTMSSRGSLRAAPRLAPSRSAGSSQSGWGLAGLALGDTASSSSPAFARMVHSPAQDPFAGVTDPLRLRTLAVDRWDVLNQHVAQLETLASEIERIARQEEELTLRPFGSAIADSRVVGERGFMPRGGAQSLADLPILARAYLHATSDVYGAARATPSPDFDMGDETGAVPDDEDETGSVPEDDLEMEEFTFDDPDA